jgi:hypothetical protein
MRSLRAVDTHVTGSLALALPDGAHQLVEMEVVHLANLSGRETAEGRHHQYPFDR